MFATLGPWAWLIAGLLLVTLEMLAPGIFLVWLGIAALLTGAVDWAFGLSWQVNLVVFAVLAVLAVLAGRALTRRSDERTGDNPMLNRRGDAMVGRIFRLDQAIVEGEGRVRVGDSSWRVTGPDLAVATPVRVVRVDGATLVVEATAAA